MDKKLTDAEIIKGLKYHSNHFCTDADYQNMIKLALDLINRLQERVDDLERNDLPRCKDALRRANEMGIELQAENERLKSKLEPQGFETADPMDFCGVLCDFAEGLIEKAKAEAYKECVEKVEKIICKNTYPDFDINHKAVIIWEPEAYKDIDNLLKELVGEDNASKN